MSTEYNDEKLIHTGDSDRLPADGVLVGVLSLVPSDIPINMSLDLESPMRETAYG